MLAKTRTRIETGGLAARALPLLVGLLAAPVAAGEEENGARQAASRELVERLDAFADWCHDESLFGERDRAFELILRYDPEHKPARRFLKYQRRKGEWEQRSSYRLPKNRNDELLGESVRRRGEAVAPYRDLLLEHARNAWEETEAGTHQALMEEIRALAPEDPALRAACGERWDARRADWILGETAEAAARRADFQEDVRSLLAAGLETEELDLTELESGLGLPWTAAYGCGRARVVGTVERAEIESCARHVEVALRLFERACGSPPVRPFTVHLLAGAGHREDLFAAHPGWTREAAEAARAWTGGWAPGSDQLALWEERAEERLETAVAQSVVWSLVTAYGIDDRQGWMIYGMRTHLATLLGHGGQLARAQAAVGASDAGRVWESIAASLPRDLDALLALPTAQLGAREKLASYALVRYLAEGRPEELARILHELPDSQEPARLLQDELRSRTDVLSNRLARWARETARTPDPVALTAGAETELLEAFAGLRERQRIELLERCVAAAEASGAPQVELVRSALGRGEADRDDLPEPTGFPALETRSSGRRAVVDAQDGRWRELRARVESRAPAGSVFYEFATGKVVRADSGSEDGEGEESRELRLLKGLLRGVLPDQDLAEAHLVARLDAPGVLRGEAEFFAHLYCDRDGRAYEGITLYDVWSSGADLEVPDIDAQAYASRLWSDAAMPSRLTAADQETWYPRIAESLQRLRTHERTARALAAVWFDGAPRPGSGFEASAQLLNTLIARRGDDVEAIAKGLADRGERYLRSAKGEIEAVGDEAWNAGHARVDRLNEGRRRIRQAVVAVLLAEGLSN